MVVYLCLFEVALGTHCVLAKLEKKNRCGMRPGVTRGRNLETETVTFFRDRRRLLIFYQRTSSFRQRVNWYRYTKE